MDGQPVRSICIFCGSSPGSSPVYAEAARRLVRRLVEQGASLVYGGSRIGLMNVVAETALQAGGRIVGVIPKSLVDREIAHRGLSELHVTDGISERKRLMEELADAFVALPGGFGTFEELAEVLSWAQLGLHDKPCGLLNTGGFYDPLVALFDRAVEAGFLRSASRSLALVDAEPEALAERLLSAPRKRFDRWGPEP